MEPISETGSPARARAAAPAAPAAAERRRAPLPLAGALRTAVVVAAGTGSRMRTAGGRPKSLEPLLGVPLLARVLRAAARAGIRRFVVVIGHQAETMRAELPALVPPGCALELIENPRFREPNGVSLLCAAHALHEPFALLMADHLFSPERLRRALERYEATGTALLAVEPRAAFAGDEEDATKVAAQDGLVTAIGKDLASWDAVDTGLFVLGAQETAAALAAAGPSPSISDGMRELARAGRLEAFALEGGFWQDVDTPEDAARASELLLQSLRKDSDGFLARHVNRRVSLWLTRRLCATGVTPDQVTLATLAIGLAAGLAFAQGSGVGWGLLGASLFQLQSIVDGVDGELARLLHKESRRGFWLDLAADNLTHMAVFAGIARGLALDGQDGPWGLLGGAAVLGVAASLAVAAPLLAPERRSHARAGGRLAALVEHLGRRDFTFLLFPLALLRLLGPFLWAAAIGTWAWAACVLGLRLRERARAGR